VLEAAVHVTGRALRFLFDRTCRASGSVVLGLHAELAGSCRPVCAAVHDAAARLLRLHDTAA